MKLQYRIPLAIYSVWCIIAILLCKDGLYQMNIWTLVEILGMIALPLLVRPFFILLRIIFRKNSFKTKDMSDNHTVCVFLSALADTSSKKAIKKHFKQLLEKLPPLLRQKKRIYMKSHLLTEARTQKLICSLRRKGLDVTAERRESAMNSVMFRITHRQQNLISVESASHKSPLWYCHSDPEKRFWKQGITVIRAPRFPTGKHT